MVTHRLSPDAYMKGLAIQSLRTSGAPGFDPDVYMRGLRNRYPTA